MIPGSLLLTSIILWVKLLLSLVKIWWSYWINCDSFLWHPLSFINYYSKSKQDYFIENKKIVRLKNLGIFNFLSKQTNTVIEGIKYIKMYVWESIFEKKIMSLREKEFLYYLNIHVLNLIDRSFNFSVHIWGSFCFILFLYFNNIPLSISSIMGTI